MVITDQAVLSGIQLTGDVEDFLDNHIPNLTPNEVKITRPITNSKAWTPSKADKDKPDGTIQSILPARFANWVAYKLGLSFTNGPIEVSNDDQWMVSRNEEV